MELLILLLERRGSVVTRKEIVDRLWGKDVFVDTEHGINTAIRKVRQALKDDPDNPRFVHTVSGKGYHFVAETNGQSAQQAESPLPKSGQRPPEAAVSAVEASRPAEVSRHSPTARPAVQSKWTNFAAIIVVCIAVAALLIYSLRNRIFPASHASQIHSIAVLPLANLSGDPSQDYFADGMTDELVTALAENRSLRVVSRTSVMRFKNSNRSLRDIASELGVDGILEGSVNRSGDHVHVNLQLIYAPTDTHVWAQSYDRDLKGALSLPRSFPRPSPAKPGLLQLRPSRSARSAPRRTAPTCKAVTTGSRVITNVAKNTSRRPSSYNRTTLWRGMDWAIVMGRARSRVRFLRTKPSKKSISTPSKLWN
jgi:TolB-like protein/DNA-binding winged helix-turn-helix (wHTH) protein